MALPNQWIDKIFLKLTLTYGREFLGRWEGLDHRAVKADWAEELGGYQQNPDAIAHALSHLPEGKPPTVQDFKVLCRSAPRKAELALPAPQLPEGRLKENMQAVAAAMAKSEASKAGRQWAHDLAGRIARKEIRPTRFQLDCVRTALGSPDGIAQESAETHQG